MRKFHAILLAIVVGLAASALTYTITSSVFNESLKGNGEKISLNEFNKVDEIINEYYLKDYNVEDVQNAGLKAMVASLNDPYSVYYTPQEFAAFNQSAAGEYYGLGMVISIDESNGLATVVEFYDGSPAEEEGIQIGDFIISIDGEDVTKKTLEEISSMCIGEVGTPIAMGIMRDGEVHEYNMERRAIAMDMLTYNMMDNEIGYMHIWQFGGNCAVLYAEAMGEFTEKGAKGIIIDLRDNPGGYLDTVVEMLDMLLPEGTLVYTEDKAGNRITKTSDPACIKIPITLIVNGNTASAAEIFAGAVQDYKYGEVVGTTTYGKGVVQHVLPVSEIGSGIKITTSEYFTPNGRSINENGVYPDYYIDLPEDFVANPNETNDTQLTKALEVLRKSFE